MSGGEPDMPEQSSSRQHRELFVTYHTDPMTAAVSRMLTTSSLAFGLGESQPRSSTCSPGAPPTLCHEMPHSELFFLFSSSAKEASCSYPLRPLFFAWPWTENTYNEPVSSPGWHGLRDQEEREQRQPKEQRRQHRRRQSRAPTSPQQQPLIGLHISQCCRALLALANDVVFSDKLARPPLTFVFLLYERRLGLDCSDSAVARSTTSSSTHNHARHAPPAHIRVRRARKREGIRTRAAIRRPGRARHRLVLPFVRPCSSTALGHREEGLLSSLC